MLRIAFAASLAANAALGFVWWTNRPATPDPTALAPVPTLLAESPPDAEPETPAVPTFAELLADADLSDADLIAQLRLCRVPAAVIRQIIRQRVHARFAAQWQALVDAAKQQPYWQRPRNRLPLETRRAMRELDRAEALVMIDLLGDDALGYADGQLSALDYDYLPAAKRQELSFILSDFGELRSETLRDARTVFLPEDREILALLRTEQEAEITALLSPEEYAAYQRRNSPAAREVQNAFRQFAATEAEYLQLLALHEPFAAQFGDVTETMIAPQEARAERRRAWQEVLQAFGASLPPDRAAEWAYATDPDIQALSRFSAAHQLDATQTLALVRFGREFESQAQSILSDRSRGEDQRRLELTQLLNAADQNLNALLTAEAREAYLKSHGNLITNLQRMLKRP